MVKLRHHLKFQWSTVAIVLTSFGGELGLNGFSASGDFLVSFNGGRAKVAKDITEFNNRLTTAVID